MKFIKFLFTLLWLLILLIAANLLLAASNMSLSPNVAAIVNLVIYGIMFVVWFLFPYTVAPVLQITESPFKLFTMRCGATLAAAIFPLGFATNF